MTENPDFQPINPFLQMHLGVHILDSRAVKIILDDPDIQRIIREAQESYQRERGRRMQTLDLGGYDHNDQYFLPREVEKVLVGKAYDASGQLRPHVVAFEAAAQALMEANPSIVVTATRTGIEIGYLKDPTDENITKSNK